VSRALSGTKIEKRGAENNDLTVGSVINGGQQALISRSEISTTEFHVLQEVRRDASYSEQRQFCTVQMNITIFLLTGFSWQAAKLLNGCIAA